MIKQKECEHLGLKLKSLNQKVIRQITRHPPSGHGDKFIIKKEVCLQKNLYFLIPPTHWSL